LPPLMSVRTYSGSTLLPSFGCSRTTASSAECPKILVLRSRILGLESGSVLGLPVICPCKWAQHERTPSTSNQVAGTDVLICPNSLGDEPPTSVPAVWRLAPAAVWYCPRIAPHA